MSNISTNAKIVNLSIVAGVTVADRERTLRDLLSPGEFRLVQAHRDMGPRYQSVIENTADRMAAENRSIPVLRLVAGGMQ